MVDGFGNATNNTITGNSSDNVLFGDAGHDTLIGGAGNDTLDGGTGADRMTGGAGNDIYVIDNLGDVVTEIANQGSDTIQTTLTSYSLARLATVENLAYIGGGNATLTGNALINALTGSSGNDTLNGGTGTDLMIGGAGNDTYIVDNVGDVITENEAGGNDSVQSSVSYILSDHIESLTLMGRAAINGTGNALDNVIRGNGAANWLFGGVGEDTIYGEAGNDWLFGFSEYEDSELSDTDFANLIASQESVIDHLYGGKGDDVYLLDQFVGTPIIYENLNEGIDTVLGDLTVYTLANNVENYVNDLNLTEDGAPVAIIITGNNLNNILKSTPTSWNDMRSILSTIDNTWQSKEEFYGLDGNDTILAGGGDDLLSGGIGNDRLIGGLGSDKFFFDTTLNSRTNVDTITDFETGTDKVVLGARIFSQLSSDISSQNLVINTTGRASDNDDFLIFNSRTKALFYDADGNGAGAAVQFATLVGVTNLNASDFLIV